jgi:hypothetical protein
MGSSGKRGEVQITRMRARTVGLFRPVMRSAVELLVATSMTPLATACRLAS